MIESIKQAIGIHSSTIISILIFMLISIIIWVGEKWARKFFKKTILNVIDNLLKKRHLLDDSTIVVFEDIMFQLTRLLGLMKSDRVSIYEFHNGSEFLSEFPRWHLSNTFEKVKNGISYDSQLLQSIPASIIWDDFLKIFFRKKDETLPSGVSIFDKDDKSCQYPRRVYKFIVEDMDSGLGPMKFRFMSYNIKFLLATPIITSKNKILGILCCDYCSHDIDIEKEIKCDEMCSLASTIAMTWELDLEKKQEMLIHQQIKKGLK